MQIITKYLIALILLAFTCQAQAQDSIPKQSSSEKLESLKEMIMKVERSALKKEVEAINDRLDAKEITYEEADILKQEVAKKHAKNIENRIAIATNRVDYLERNDYDSVNHRKDNLVSISIGGDQWKVLEFRTKHVAPKYDIRTSNQLVFAMGLNNALIDGQSLDDSPYKIGGSGFVELGWVWKTRLLKDSNFARIKYGFSFQWNKFKIKDNQYFVQDGNTTELQPFPGDIVKAKFRNTNLVFPVHFEFGPSKRLEKKDRIRYSTNDQFKIGFGGYAGVNIASQQKIIYKEGGDRIKDKIRRPYNVNNFVYGISGYIGIGDISLYAKYDLSEVFKDQAVKQNNISLGLRVDLD